MRRIGLGNDKGGCGKTLTVVSTASALARKGRRVLVIDGDPHASATWHLRKGLKKEGYKTLYDYLIWGAEIDEVIEATEFKNLWIIRGDERLSLLDNLDVVALRMNEMVSILEGSFDYCFLDSQPSMAKLRTGLMLFCEEIIVPLFPDSDSVKGLVNQLKEHALWSHERERILGEPTHLAGVVIVNYNDEWATHRTTLPEIREVLLTKQIPLLGVIPTSASAPNAPRTGLPIPWNGRLRKSKIYMAFDKLVKSLENEGVKLIEVKKRSSVSHEEAHL